MEGFIDLSYETLSDTSNIPDTVGKGWIATELSESDWTIPVSDEALEEIDQIFVDTKFEFGYVHDAAGNEKLIYMDEVGTPDSSRIWDGDAFARGDVVENSKEGFRQALLNFAADPDVLLNKSRMEERLEFARNTVLPTQMMLDVSKTYVGVAERIMGEKLDVSDDPRTEIIQVLRDNFDIIDPQ